MFRHVKQSDCKAAVKVVSGIGLKVCELLKLLSDHCTLQGSTANKHIGVWFFKNSFHPCQRLSYFSHF